MNTIYLLDKLNLNDHYPQKLSFSEAIKLRGQSQNGSPKPYGLEIVIKLLMLDFTAVTSVTSEINKRLNNSDNTNTEIKGQCISDEVKPPQNVTTKPPVTANEEKQIVRKLHPMDVLVVVMNCCDDFLRQILVEKMFANKLSIPILLPDQINDTQTLLIFALRSLFPEVPMISATALTDALVDVKNPIVSFIRVGERLYRSKSKIVNDLLGFNTFNTFFHRKCPNGYAERTLSIGSIEAAWFQSETATEEELNCRFFTALNLRGDARDYPKQTQLLFQASMLVVIMVDSFGSFKELYEKVLKDANASQTKVIVFYISTNSPDEKDKTNFKLWNDSSGHSIIVDVKYGWNDEEKMNDFDFKTDLRETIPKFLKSQHMHSNQMPTYSSMSLSAQKLGFLVDESNLEYNVGKASADEIFDLVLNLPSDCKPLILPLQGEPWIKFGNLEREQRKQSKDKSQVEHFIAEKETEKRRQREMQCHCLIPQNKTSQIFFEKFHSLQDHALLHYLNSCKIKLDARSRVYIKDIMKKYNDDEQESHPQQSNGTESEVKLSKMESTIANSTIGLEHFLRECGQIYEAVISEKFRMQEELKKATLAPDVILTFPTIVAELLLMGHQLELMDGDASNVPITWLKAVLDQIECVTSNAKIFVLSIIGVQSSGKSTLLNALFGLQFPVSAGRCTRGVYCHLVPVDKKSLCTEYDYILVVDTEGLGSSEFTGKSTFRDNELATFAIGLADATIINMKGENWAEMKDILQIVSYGLIRIRKTKTELNLMPKCMFVHQNVAATNAEEMNRIGQERQLLYLDKAIKDAAMRENLTEITKFADVIEYGLGSHSWYFPDLWDGKPPKARVNKYYIEKIDKLRQHLIELMKTNTSKLTISSLLLRISDLWDAMLHNDFVLCFTNTEEALSGTDLNDRIADGIDRLKNLNKLAQTKARESIFSFTSVQEFRAEKDRLLREVNDAVEKNFTNIKPTLEKEIDDANIGRALKQESKTVLITSNDGELHRINDETIKEMNVHMKKLEIGEDQRVKDIKVRLANLEKLSEEVEKDKLNETATRKFEASWQNLISDKNLLVNERIKIMETEIMGLFCGLAEKSSLKEVMQFASADWEDIFKTAFDEKIPAVTKDDIVGIEGMSFERIMNYIILTPNGRVSTANSSLNEARKKWELRFKHQRGLEVSASHLDEVMTEVGQLLGILQEEYEDRPEPHEMCSVLQPGYSFTREYIISFTKYACRFLYNQSLENSKALISMTDPLPDIGDRFIKSVSCFRLISAEANIDVVSKEIFDYAKKSFAKVLGESIKAEVSKADNKNPAFKYKRAFLRAILKDLGKRTHNLTDVNDERSKVFKDYMLYVQMAESGDSENFFLDAIVKLLKEMLTKGNTSEKSHFQKMVETNVEKVVKKAELAMSYANALCKGRAKEYILLFKEYMGVTNEIDFRIINLDGFSKAVTERIKQLNADFLSQANSSFETIICQDDKAAIRPLFEKIMGCRERCPFCSAPCSHSQQDHAGHHRAIHYPTGVGGTVESWGLLANIHETYDATDEDHRQPRKLAIKTCQTMVGTKADVRTKWSVQKYTEWYHRLFKLNFHSFRNYRDVKLYANWDIPFSGDPTVSLYWKWFMVKFDKELGEHYQALSPEIPELWKTISWDEAEQNLYELDRRTPQTSKNILSRCIRFISNRFREPTVIPDGNSAIVENFL